MHCHTQLFCGAWESRLRFSCLRNRVFYQPSVLSAPFILLRWGTAGAVQPDDWQQQGSESSQVCFQAHGPLKRRAPALASCSDGVCSETLLFAFYLKFILQGCVCVCVFVTECVCVSHCVCVTVRVSPCVCRVCRVLVFSCFV